MQTNIVLLMLIPTVDEDISYYNFISSDEENISIPTIEIQDTFGSIDNVLRSTTEYYLGTLDFEPNYVLYDVLLNANIVNIYYYTFLPFNTEISNGQLVNIENIQFLSIYKKIIQKIY